MKLKSCVVRGGSTVQIVSMLRGGGKHKDKNSQSKKKQAKSPKRLEPLKRQQEEKREEEPRSDEGPGIPEDGVIQKQLKEIEGHPMMIECVSEGSEGEVEEKINNYTGFQKLPGVDKKQVENIEVAVRRSFEASRKRRGTEREQTAEMEQCKKVRFAEEEPRRTVRGDTQAQSTDKQGVMSGLEEVRTGRGSAGLVRGEDDRRRTDGTSGKGKGRGNGGKGEHGGMGGNGGKGLQQSVNVLKGEEGQQADEEDERVQVAPNMGAGGSHPQATSDPVEEGSGNEEEWATWVDNVEEKRKARKLR